MKHYWLGFLILQITLLASHINTEVTIYFGFWDWVLMSFIFGALFISGRGYERAKNKEEEENDRQITN